MPRDRKTLRSTQSHLACLRYVPPIGLGITPLLVMLESPVQTNAVLLRVQTLHNIPVDGKLSEDHRQLLKDKISEYYGSVKGSESEA